MSTLFLAHKDQDKELESWAVMFVLRFVRSGVDIFRKHEVEPGRGRDRTEKKWILEKIGSAIFVTVTTPRPISLVTTSSMKPMPICSWTTCNLLHSPRSY